MPYPMHYPFIWFFITRKRLTLVRTVKIKKAKDLVIIKKAKDLVPMLIVCFLVNRYILQFQDLTDRLASDGVAIKRKAATDIVTALGGTARTMESLISIVNKLQDVF